MLRVFMWFAWGVLIVGIWGAGRAAADRGSLASGWLGADRRAQPLAAGLEGRAFVDGLSLVAVEAARRTGNGATPLAEDSGSAGDDGGDPRFRAAGLGAAFDAALLAGGGAAALDGIRRSALVTARFLDTGVAGLRNLIASVEAGPHGYDAVHLSARVLPDAPPTRLTIGEIRAWIAATPGQQHAIGRYQFIPSTLEMLTNRLKVPPDARFSPALQDRLADELLADAGLAAFRAGRLGRDDFMHNLAAIWAGLPVASGKSYYAGIAGNAAGMGWHDYARRMAALFPD